MITINEPKKYISDLWAKPSIERGNLFRLMQYVLKVEQDGNVLLHNVVTGQTVLLNQEEAALLNKLPMVYHPELNPLIEGRFLVRDTFDEHRLVQNIRIILGKLQTDKPNPGITTYTILPTTACNARCYYCFEKGSKAVTMTKQTGDEVVRFIKNNCGDKKKVFLAWFGGEPTVASSRIDQICEGLYRSGISYTSKITSNGYMFDVEMVQKARRLWNLVRAQITLDGTEDTYNRTKAYVSVKDNPYKRVLNNVRLLLEHGIKVDLRMNFDLGNYFEFQDLVADVKDRFQKNKLLQIHVHPVVGEYPDSEGKLLHGSDDWFEKKIIELNNIARENGLLSTNRELPFLQYKGCQATSDSAVVITPEGNFVRCPEQYGDDQITGSLWEGITDYDLVYAWKEFSDYEKCRDCVLFPYCLRTLFCSVKDRCCYLPEFVNLYYNSMRHLYIATKYKYTN